MKLAKGLGNFKGVFARKCVASNDPFFASVESGNVSREQPQPGSPGGGGGYLTHVWV